MHRLMFRQPGHKALSTDSDAAVEAGFNYLGRADGVTESSLRFSCAVFAAACVRSNRHRPDFSPQAAGRRSSPEQRKPALEMMTACLPTASLIATEVPARMGFARSDLQTCEKCGIEQPTFRADRVGHR